MKTVKDQSASSKKLCLFGFGGDIIMVPGSDIIYIHTEQRKLYLHTVHGVYRIGGSLKAAVKKVQDLPMIKTHGSYLVNLEYLLWAGRREAILKNGEHIPVSVRCRPLIRAAMEAYVKQQESKNPLTGE